MCPNILYKRIRLFRVNCGCDHVVVVSKSGRIYAWGRNKYGQLGLGYAKNKKLPQLLNFKF